MVLGILKKLPKHHFVPVFYLSGWKSRTGHIVEFKKTFKEIKPRRTAPDGTGYVRGLYLLPGQPTENSQRFETQVMQKVDDLAARAIAKLRNLDMSNWTRDERSAWTRFLISMFVRPPGILNRMRARNADPNDIPDFPDARAQYEKSWREGDPSFDKFMEAQGGLGALEVMLRLMNSPNLGVAINNMIWDVIDCRDSVFELMTSDRPIVSVNGVAQKGAFLSLPISPHLLFIAANDLETIKRIARLKVTDLVKRSNREVVSGATEYVWASNDIQLSFVRRWMSVDKESYMPFIEEFRHA